MASGKPQGSGANGSVGQQILMILLAVAALWVIFRLVKNEGLGIAGLGGKDPNAIRLTYVPADFSPNLDEQATLQILTQPDKYRKEFNELVYNFNLSLLFHVANRMGLPDSLKRELEPQYKRHHSYLRDLYYEEFAALRGMDDATLQSWYNDNANQAVNLFHEVSGKYTCFFITQIMATLLKTGNIAGGGRNVQEPCAIALNEGLQPLVARLQRQAAIMDFSASRGMLKEKVRRGIAELATYEIQNRLGLDKQLNYKVLGFNISRTDLRLEAVSVIKAGFKLDQQFDVTFNPNQGVIFVTLPPPAILSHEVYPKVDRLDVGWLAGISGDELNRNLNALRQEARRDALENERILQKAQMRADSVMQMLLGPIAKGMNRNYRIQVRYKDLAPSLDAPPATHTPPAPPASPAPDKPRMVPQ
ncbi:MAG: DUF4230 domain-containing protein [Saprospiraceae bacterium]